MSSVSMCLFVFFFFMSGVAQVPTFPHVCGGDQRIPLDVGPSLNFLANLMSTFQGLFTAG